MSLLTTKDLSLRRSCNRFYADCTRGVAVEAGGLGLFEGHNGRYGAHGTLFVLLDIYIASQPGGRAVIKRELIGRPFAVDPERQNLANARFGLLPEFWIDALNKVSQGGVLLSRQPKNLAAHLVRPELMGTQI